MSHVYGETPRNVFSDFDWIHLHEKELLEKYGECSIIVYKEQVLGVGATYDEALANAEQNLPLEMGAIFTWKPYPVQSREFLCTGCPNNGFKKIANNPAEK